MSVKVFVPPKAAAWAGAPMDGDGSFALGPHGFAYLRLEMTSSNEPQRTSRAGRLLEKVRP